MKNSILGFILGVFAVISIAAGTSSTELLTVKPAKPKLTIVEEFNRCDGTEMKQFIKIYSKQGYISKIISGSDCATIIIMEKY